MHIIEKWYKHNEQHEKHNVQLLEDIWVNFKHISLGLPYVGKF